MTNVNTFGKLPQVQKHRGLYSLTKCTTLYMYIISRVYFRILPQRGQTPSSKNSRGGGGKYKAKEGQPHIKRTEKPIPRGGQTDPKGGQKHPLAPPPEINPD